MTQTKHLTLFVKGNADLVDVTVSKSAGGGKLTDGVAERTAARFPHVTVDVKVDASSGFDALREEIDSGSSTLIDADPDIVLLSIADDVETLPSRGANPEEAVRRVREDLVAAIAGIKEKVGAHVLVVGGSTFDPGDRTYNFHDPDVDPVSLRVQRLDLMLVGVSHDEGVSIVDVDRLIAELGAAEHVQGIMDYSAAAAAVVADDVVRILEDYGFFDDRPLLAQVGAAHQGSA